MKRKNKNYMAILGVALVTILAAGYVNAQIVLDYESFKKSVRNTIYADNLTVDLSIKLESQGKTYADERAVLKIDKINQKYQNTNYYTDKSTNTVRVSETFTDSNKRIYAYEDHLGEMRYNVHINDNDGMNRNQNSTNILDIPDEAIDILELAADAFVGTAKEQFVRIEGDNSSTITGTFDRTQIPAIGNALVNLAFSQTASFYNDSYKPDAESFEGLIYNNKIDSVHINSVVFDSVLDAQGLFENVNIRTQLIAKSETGAELPIEIIFNYKITNKGSTAIAIPDVDKNDENVSWSGYYDNNYYEENQDTINEYYNRMEKVRNRMYNEPLTEDDRQRLKDALDAFDAVFFGDEE